MASVDLLNDPSLEQAPAEAERNSATTWGDILTGLGIGARQVGASVRGAQQYMSDLASTDKEDAKHSYYEADRKYLEKMAEVDAESYSPRAKQVKAMSALPKDGQESAFGSWANFKDFVVVNGVEAVPSLVASALPAALVGPVLGATAATVAAGGVGSALNAGDLYNDIAKSIDSLPDAELQRKSEGYRAYRGMMGEEDARAAFRSDLVGYKPLISAAITALTTRYGVEGLIARRAGGEATHGFVKSTGIGVLGEGSQEFGETFGNEVLAGAAREQGGIGEVEWRDALAKSLDAAIVGGVLGGAGGLASGKFQPKESPAPAAQPAIDPTLAAALPAATAPAPAATAPAATAASVTSATPPKGTGTGTPPKPNAAAPVGDPNASPTRSETQYPKGEAAKKTSKLRSGVEVANGPVGTTEAAALTPEQKLATITQPAPAAPVAPIVETERTMPPAAVQSMQAATRAPLPAATQPVVETERPVQGAPVQAVKAVTPQVKGKAPTVEEKPEQIAAQFDDMAKGNRAVVMVPKRGKGMPEIAVPKIKGMKKLVLDSSSYPPDARGTFYYNPDRISYSEIMKAAESGRLNDVLNMGPTSKDDAAQAIQQGAAPAAVQLRNENGTPKVEQATTSATVAQDAAAIAAQAQPTDTLEVTTPQAVIGERLTPKAAQAVAAAKKPAERAEKRIIYQETAEAKKATEEYNVAAQDRDKRLAAMPEQAPDTLLDDAPSTGPRTLKSNDTKRVEAAELNAAKARELFNQFPPAEAEAAWAGNRLAERQPARAAIVQRVKTIMVEAKRQKIEIPKAIRSHGPELLWLKEVSDFSKKVGTKAAEKGIVSESALIHFVEQETLLRGGEEAVHTVYDTRRVEGDAFSRKSQGDVEQQKDEHEDARASKDDEQIEDSENSVEHKNTAVDTDARESVFGEKRRTEEEVYAAGRDRPPVAAGDDAYTSVQNKAGTFAVESGKGRRKLNVGPKPAAKITLNKKPITQEVTEEPSGTAPKQEAEKKSTGGAAEAEKKAADRKATAASFLAARKRMAEEKKAAEEAAAAEGEEDASQPANTVKIRGRGVVPERSVALNDMLKGFDFSTYGPLFPIIRDRIMREVKGVTVHFLPPDQMLHLTGQETSLGRWWYTTETGDQIFIRNDLDTEKTLHTGVHEAVHALLVRAMDSDPAAQRAVAEIMAAVRKHYAAGAGVDIGSMPTTRYAFTSADEFVAEAWGNKEVQEILLNTPIPADLAAKFGIEDWRKKSLWHALIELFTKIARLPKGAVSAMEAIAKVTDDVANKRAALNPSDGEFSSDLRVPTTSEVTDAASDRSAAMASWAKRTAPKLMSGDQMRQQFSGTVVGPALEQIWNAVHAAGPKARDIKREGDILAARAVDAAHKHSARIGEFAQLLETARMLGVSIEGSNAHLGKDDSANWQAVQRLPALQATFASLPPDLKQLYRDMASFYSGTHNRIVRASVSSILDTLLIKNKLTSQEVADLTTRVMDQKLTDADKILLGPTVFENLKNAREFHKVKGDYFPLMRFGDHVVRTQDKIADTKGGKLIGEDVVEFSGATKLAARRAAKAFVLSTDLLQLGRVKAVLYDKNTGKRLTTDEAKSHNFVEVRYQVRVQTRGVYFFDTGTEAERFVRTNPNGHDTIHPPELRSGTGYQAHILSATQLSSFEHSINARTDLSDGQKRLLKSIMVQSATRMMSGNRIATHRLKTQKVTGASNDFARALLQYNTAASRHITTAEAAPEIRDGLGKMDKALRNYEGNDRPQLMALQDEVKARVDMGIHEPNEAGKVMKDILSLSFLARLFSPMHSIINSLQPAMVTAPILGGRFGNVRATRALADAYGTIGLGEAALAGAINTARATRQFANAGLLGMDDVVGNIRKKIAGDKNMTAMFDRLIELGAIDVDAGMEVNASVADGRGAWGKGLAATDRIARQMPQAVEAVNRAVSAIASYRLARESGMNHDKATQFALDTVKNTQGDYSASNAARFFNNPVLRPAMQFRKYAQMMTYLLADVTHRAFKDASPEERAVARKQLLNFVAVQIAMAGALSVPGLELVKVAFLVAAALGFGDGWDDNEEKLRKLVDHYAGKELGQMITSGVFTRLGGFGVDVSQRMSLSDLWLFGEPRKNDADGQMAYLFKLLAGSSGTFIIGALDGFRDVGNGDFEKGLGKMLPIKFASDFAKGVGQYRQGRANLLEVGVNTLGVRSARQAEESRKVADTMRRKDAKDAERRKLAKAFYDAKTSGEKVKAAARNREFNMTLREGEWRLRLPTNAGV